MIIPFVDAVPACVNCRHYGLGLLGITGRCMHPAERVLRFNPVTGQHFTSRPKAADVRKVMAGHGPVRQPIPPSLVGKVNGECTESGRLFEARE